MNIRRERKFMAILLAIVIIMGSMSVRTSFAEDTTNGGSTKNTSIKANMYKTGEYVFAGLKTGRWAANIGGKVVTAYCIQPSLQPYEGSNTADALPDGYNISKAMYYCYGYPGWKNLKPWIQKNYPSTWEFWNDYGNGYLMCHFMLGYIYNRDSKWNKQLTSVQTKNIIAIGEHVKSLSTPPIDSTVSMSPYKATASWQKDGTDLFKTETITLKSHDDNYVKFTVPAGITLANITTGITYNGGSVATINGNDKFNMRGDLTAAKNLNNYWTSGTLNSAFDDYTAYRFDAPTGFQNIAFFGVSKGDTTSLSVTFGDVNYGKLQIKKLKEEIKGNIPEEGAKFQVWNNKYTNYEEAVSNSSMEKPMAEIITTDNTGIATTGKLFHGNYIVHQISGSNMHLLMEDITVEISSDVTDGDLILVGPEGGIVDLRYAQKLVLQKKDATTGTNIMLAGTEFQIYDESGKLIKMANGTIDYFTTNKDGKFETPESLPSGEYFIVERKAPQGYVLSDKPLKVKIFRSDETVTDSVQDEKYCIFENHPQMGVIRLKKIGEHKEDGTVKKEFLPNVSFDVVAAEDIRTGDGTLRATKGKVVDRIITNKEGNAESKQLFLGKYYLVEKGVIDEKGNISNKINGIEYFIDKNPRYLELEYKDPTEEVVYKSVAVTNYEITGNAEISKADVSTGKLIPNCEISILNKDKEVILRDKTDANGIVKFKSLPKGTYYYQETKAPQGYNIDTKAHKFVIKDKGEIVKAEMTDKIITGRFQLIKKDLQSKEPLKNAHFEIKDSTGKVVYKGVTDEKGQWIVSDIPYGKYTFYETKAPQGYKLQTEIHSFTIEKEGQTIENVVTNDKEGTPRTGDTANLEILFLLLLIAVISLIFAKKKTR